MYSKIIYTNTKMQIFKILFTFSIYFLSYSTIAKCQIETNYYFQKNKNNIFGLKNLFISSLSEEKDFCYEKINKEVLWVFSSIANNLTELFESEYKNTHFAYLTGLNYNDLGEYERCLQRKEMKYFLSKLTLQKMDQNISIFQGTCLPIECQNKTSLDNLEGKLRNILNFTNNETIKLLDIEKLNKRITDYSISTIIIILILSLYLFLNCGIIQKFILKIFIKSFNYGKLSETKENQRYDLFLNDRDKDNSSQNIKGKNNENENPINNLSYSYNIKKNINFSNNLNSLNPNQEDLKYDKNSENFNSNKIKTEITDDINIRIANFTNNSRKLSDPEKTILEKSKLYNFLQKFNFIYNYKKIFLSETSENNEFKFLDFIRVLLCYYIVILHSLVFIMDTPVRGIETFMQKVKSFPFQLIVNASFIVDIFFTISAFFLGYLGLTKFNSNSSSIKYFFNLIAFRLIRIWPIVIANFIIFWKIFPLLNPLGDGPVYGLIFENEYGSCEKQWPFIITFLTNFTYGTWEKIAPVCLGWYWYLPIDLQMYVIGVILIIIYKKNNNLFFIIFVFLIALGVIFEIICLIKLDYGMNIFTQGTIMTNFTDYYIKLYNRCFPFWIGFFFGINYCEFKIILGKYEKNINSNDIGVSSDEKHSNNETDKEEIDNKFNVLHKFFFKLKRSNSFSYLVFIISNIIMFSIIFVVYFSYDVNTPKWVNFIYNFLSRKLFSFGFILFCFSMVNGHLETLNKLMSNKIFNLPAKLSFAIYLCHPCIIKLNYYSTKSSFYLSFYQIFLLGIGFCVISSIYAFFLYLSFEIPFMNFKSERKNSYVNKIYIKKMPQEM